jgi:hypothetical protein
MREQGKVRELLASVVSPPIDVEGRGFHVSRGRIVSAILAAAARVDAERASRKRWRTFAGTAAGFAALVGSAEWFAHRNRSTTEAAEPSLSIADVHGVVTHLDHGVGHSFAPGQTATIAPDGEVITAPQSEARLRTPSGLEIGVFEKSRMSLAGLRAAGSFSVSLATGDIRCRVPHLTETHTFSVITPTATVVVHGTVFRVTVSGQERATETCVRVEEGVVGVQTATGETLVSADRSWGCNLEEQAAALVAPSPSTEHLLNRLRPMPKERPTGTTRATAGTLDEENRIFQAGLSAERQGDALGAGAFFEQLLSRYPDSPLASDTRRALARVRCGSQRER